MTEKISRWPRYGRLHVGSARHVALSECVRRYCGPLLEPRSNLEIIGIRPLDTTRRPRIPSLLAMRQRTSKCRVLDVAAGTGALAVAAARTGAQVLAPDTLFDMSPDWSSLSDHDKAAIVAETRRLAADRAVLPIPSTALIGAARR